MAHKVSVMDFGSEKISVFVGERGLNNTIRVIGVGVREYSGFIDGEILEPLKLKEAMEGAIADAQDVWGQKIESLYLGVPSDFCVTACKTLSLNFKKKHKVTQYDIQDLYNSCDDFDKENDYEIINVTPIYFMLDSDRRLMDPEGQTTTSLTAMVSFVLAEKRFTEPMREILKGVGINEVGFSSTALAQLLYLFPSQKRDSGVVLVDVGYLTTEVIVAKGDGILCMKSFANGGANITADISTCLDVPFKQAEKIKRKLMLSLATESHEIYEFELNGKPEYVSKKSVNEIATERIKIIARGIEKCIARCEYEYPDYTPYSITGGGIAFIRGAKEIVASVTGKKTEIVAPTAPLAERPNLSAPWSLMDMAIAEDFGKKSFWNKIFKKAE
ncbi:MAG: pilus assembly protein PilM [Clostridia bacterium]|nr:pilus assembly protein PilM [Clostridia bacterium]